MIGNLQKIATKRESKKKPASEDFRKPFQTNRKEMFDIRVKTNSDDLHNSQSD